MPLIYLFLFVLFPVHLGERFCGQDITYTSLNYYTWLGMLQVLRLEQTRHHPLTQSNNERYLQEGLQSIDCIDYKEHLGTETTI